jgi:hypothetical protein
MVPNEDVERMGVKAFFPAGGQHANQFIQNKEMSIWRWK